MATIRGSKTKKEYTVGKTYRTGAYEYTAMADGTFKRGKRVGAEAPASPKTAVSTQLAVTRPKGSGKVRTAKAVTSKVTAPIPKTRPRAGLFAPTPGAAGTPTGRYKPVSPYGGKGALAGQLRIRDTPSGSTKVGVRMGTRQGPPTKEQAAPRPKQRSVALRNKQNRASGKEQTNATGGKRYVGPFANDPKKDRKGRKTGGGF